MYACVPAACVELAGQNPRRQCVVVWKRFRLRIRRAAELEPLAETIPRRLQPGHPAAHGRRSRISVARLREMEPGKRGLSAPESLRCAAGAAHMRLAEFVWKRSNLSAFACLLFGHLGRIQGERLGLSPPPPKPKKVILFSMIFYNSESNIRDMSPFCHPLFCHSSVVKYTLSLLQ